MLVGKIGSILFRLLSGVVILHSYTYLAILGSSLLYFAIIVLEQVWSSRLYNDVLYFLYRRDFKIKILFINRSLMRAEGAALYIRILLALHFLIKT